MKTENDRIFVLLITFFVLLISCEKPNVNEDSKLVSSLHANSHDTIIIGTSKYVLESDLSRNLMPGYPHKSPLVALIFLVNLDSIPIPSELDISKLYVINDQIIWTSDPVDSNQPQVPNFKLDKMRNDGPKWDVNIFVDVIAEVINKSTNDKYLIISRHQIIQKLE